MNSTVRQEGNRLLLLPLHSVDMMQITLDCDGNGHIYKKWNNKVEKELPEGMNASPEPGLYW